MTRILGSIEHHDLTATLTHLERCLLRLGRVRVDAEAGSRARDAVMALAGRGLMLASRDANGSELVCEVTQAGRCALAWAEEPCIGQGRGELRH